MFLDKAFKRSPINLGRSPKMQKERLDLNLLNLRVAGENVRAMDMALENDHMLPFLGQQVRDWG